jgi:hypothetical protein
LVLLLSERGTLEDGYVGIGSFESDGGTRREKSGPLFAKTAKGRPPQRSLAA